MFRSLLSLAIPLSLTLPAAAARQDIEDHATVHKGLTYAEVDGKTLKLDLYIPKGVENPPLIVYIHGGGWRKGSRAAFQLPWLVTHPDGRFAVASIDYRLTDTAIFPAQIHDVKGALRWLRAHAAEYGYDAAKVGVAGTSAGGHLALLLGVTAEIPEMEGTVGGNTDKSSRVDAIANYFGPSDFQPLVLGRAF